MPTDENLCSRGCAIVSMCNFCLKNVETSDHLFLHCNFAASLWNWLGLQLQLVFDVSFVQALLNSLPRPCSSQVNYIYLEVIVHLIHSIWWARNNLRFSSNGVTLHAVQVRVHSLIGLSGGLSTGKCIVVDANLPYWFRVPHHRRLIKEVVSVCWKAPTAPWVKVNTDGSVIDKHGTCGGLFRDHLGTFLGAFTCNLGRCSVFRCGGVWLHSCFEVCGPRWLDKHLVGKWLFQCASCFQKYIVGAYSSSEPVA